MDKPTLVTATPQGFGLSKSERLPIPERSAMNDAQREATDAIVNNLRKVIVGPFVPLLQTPLLMGRIGKTGEALRFDGSLPERVRELAICVVARETGNQFEWQNHAEFLLAPNHCCSKNGLGTRRDQASFETDKDHRQRAKAV